MPPWIDQRFQELLACMCFYTRLPLGRWIRGDPGLAAAHWAAPLAGAGIGIAAGIVYWFAVSGGLAPIIAAALCLAATLLISGALHEDGLADTADGLGGGASVEDKLAIMRDSRLGAYGALALIMSILIRWTALASFAGPAVLFVAMIAAHGGSRAIIPLFMSQVVSAQRDGVSSAVGQSDSQVVAVAIMLGVAALVPGGFVFTLVTIIALVAWFQAVKFVCNRQIGGQTGDVIGALQQGAEIIILLLASAYLSAHPIDT